MDRSPVLCESQSKEGHGVQTSGTEEWDSPVSAQGRHGKGCWAWGILPTAWPVSSLLPHTRDRLKQRWLQCPASSQKEPTRVRSCGGGSCGKSTDWVLGCTKAWGFPGSFLLTVPVLSTCSGSPGQASFQLHGREARRDTFCIKPLACLYPYPMVWRAGKLPVLTIAHVWISSASANNLTYPAERQGPFQTV